MVRLVHFLLVFVLVISLPGCGHDSASTESSASDQPQFTYIQFPESVAEVETLTEEAILRCERTLDEILSQASPNFSNTIHALTDAVDSDLESVISYFGIVADLSPSSEVRDAAYEASDELVSYRSQLFKNDELYLVVTEAVAHSDSLNDEQQAVVSTIVNRFKNNDLSLDASDQETLISLRERVRDLVIEFRKNLYSGDFDPEVTFTAEELQGVPDSVLNQFQPDGAGNYTNLPYATILEFASSEETRKKAFIAQYSVARDVNPELFAEIAQLRARIAEIYGYDSFSAYKTASLMAGSPQTVAAFLTDLNGKIAEKRSSEIDVLEKIKQQETGDATATLNVWDVSYYKKIYLEDFPELDTSSFNKYFEWERTLNGMFSIFEGVLNIKIIKRDTSAMQLWSEDVRLYEVHDGDTDRPLGLFYLDPYLRDGKYPYYETWPASARNRSAAGKVTLPTSVLIGPWRKPDLKSNTPILLTFDEMVGLFHEFGHTLDDLLIASDYAVLAYPHWDFIEVPSQLFERYCYDQDALATFAVNYQDEADTLPENFVDVIRQREQMFIGMFTGTQLSYAMTDQIIYSMSVSGTETLDVDAVFREVSERYYMPFPEEASRMAQIVHLIDNYPSTYYGYLWSDAIVADIKSAFHQSNSGLLNSDTGFRFRQEILEPGSLRNENESLSLFLGRDWSVDAYAEELFSGK